MEKVKFVEDCLFKGKVCHTRFFPVKHELEYKLVYFWLDLLPQKKFKFLSFDANSIFNFNSYDFGCAKRTSFSSLFEYWKNEIKYICDDDIATIKVLCLPRIINYSFNPITVFICYDKNKKASVMILEVRNTFGEKHAYISKLNCKVLNTSKKFHVSPFLKNKGEYFIEFQISNQILKLEITYFVKKKKILFASFSGTKKMLCDSNLLRLFCTNFMQNVKVTVGIHFEALKLWVKGAMYNNKPKPPKKFITKVD